VIFANGALEAAAIRGAVAVLVLAACACAKQEKPKPIDENAPPLDYRAQVADLLHRELGPSNVRDAFIAEPVLKTFLPTPRFVVCLKFNAANSSGAYTGSKLYAAYFYAGKITQVVDATVEQCDKAAFMPFPELK
jgi:hypothetical protein